MTQNKANLRLSTIDDHTYDMRTDKLYDPLRNMILHPQVAARHEMSSPRAVEKSLMNDRYHPFTNDEANKLKRNIYIPVQSQLIATDHMNIVQRSNFRVIDAQERIIGEPIRGDDILKVLTGKKDTRVVYELGKQIEIAPVAVQNNSGGLLQYNRSNPNLRSQIIGNESSASLARVGSDSKLPTMGQFNMMLSFREKEQIRTMRESQVNPEAKGYLYEYNLTSEGTEVKAKLKRKNSLSSLKGSTILQAIPIPGNPMPSSQQALHRQLQQQSASLQAPLVRDYQGSVPVPMVKQSQNTTSQVQIHQQPQPQYQPQPQQQHLTSVNQYSVTPNYIERSNQVAVDNRFITPSKVRGQDYDYKDLATTGIKESPEREDYRYNMQPQPQDKGTGCGLFTCGDDHEADNRHYR